jgi:pimeloyl-ACP methyl ester carboxylesterase
MARDNRELQVDDWGAGPAVVLLHGTPSSPDDFAPLVESLAERHRVLVPHLPGYGRTPPDPGFYSLGDVITRLEDALISRGVVQVDFVAFSGGTYKAVAVALGGRVAVTRLVLLAPVVGFDADVAQAYRDVAAASRSGSFDPRASWLERMASPGFAQRDPSGAARVLSWLDAVPAAVLCDELDAMADAADLRPRLRELSCPVLACAGANDRAVPPIWAREVAASVPGAISESIAGAGHALLVEAPGVVSRLIGDFLG